MFTSTKKHQNEVNDVIFIVNFEHISHLLSKEIVYQRERVISYFEPNHRQRFS